VSPSRPPALSFWATEKRRRRQKRYLRALDLDTPMLCDLAESLVKCAGGSPCGLPFCPLCVRVLRRRCLPALSNHVTPGGSVGADEGPVITRFTAEPRKGSHAAPIRALRALSLDEIRRLTFGSLQTLQVPAFAWLDVALHEDSRDRWEAFWQIRIEGVAFGASAAEVIRALSRAYPGDHRVPQPVTAEPVRDLAVAIKDSIKLTCSRHVHRRAADRYGTRRCPLPPYELQELMRFLAAYDLWDRFVFVNASGGELRLGRALPENENKYDWR
jgi:hypothetical protein